MPFNSFNFWLLFPSIFIVYWAIPSNYNKIRNYFLLFVSYFMYMLWKPSFALVLLYVTFVTYWGALNLKRNFFKNKKNLSCICVILGFLPLFIFKYYNFINESVKGLLEEFGINFNLPGLNWAIPIGISFFSFQAVGYFIDVYRKRTLAERSFVNYALFVSFFPQVTSGPISKADELLPQIKKKHTFNYNQAKQGLKFLLWGMFIKLVIADRLGLYVDTVYNNYINYSGSTLFLASIFYTIQIYCDFAGYSFMAIGIARTIGFDLINNFQRPYFAKSVTEFWKRWHISLTRWLTTYVYIELGGNRCSRFRQYFNILITFLVSGLWHGANWTFVVWGGIHGFLQIFEKVLYGNKIKSEIKSKKISLVYFPRIIVTFLCVNFAWIFFRMPSLSDGLNVVENILYLRGEKSIEFLSIVSIYPAVIIILGLLILFVKDFKDEFFPDSFKFINYLPVRWSVYILLFVILITCGVLDGGQFIYSNF